MLRILLIFLFMVSSGGPAELELATYLKQDMDFLLTFYKGLHERPELSLMEEKTAGKLAMEMKAVGFEVTENFGGYGIVCVMKNGEGPTMLYRTDMDGLPVVEKTELPYASSFEMADTEGNSNRTMHACGHDVHMTVWLGTARAMSEMKDIWSGTLIFIGQPAEEIGVGARLMLEAGLYDKFPVPDFGVGLHSSPSIPAGQVGFGKGNTMARSESIDITVFGRGAHGASPHKSVDPVVLASLMVMELQTIVSRNVDPLESAVLTVGSIKGGTRHNIIPDEVHLQITLRTFKDEVRFLIHQRIREIAKGIAISAGLSEDKYPSVSIPENSIVPNYNDPALVDRLSGSAIDAIGEENVLEAGAQMVSEDFALYGHTEEKVPTVLFWLGTIPQDRASAAERGEPIPALHSPYYFPDPEPSITTGVMVMSKIGLDLLSK